MSAYLVLVDLAARDLASSVTCWVLAPTFCLLWAYSRRSYAVRTYPTED